MTIHHAFAAGLAGNVLSKKITGTDEVCASRSLVATGSGAALGAVAAGTLVVAFGVAAAPVTVPLAAASGLVALVSSRFS